MSHLISANLLPTLLNVIHPHAAQKGFSLTPASSTLASAAAASPATSTTTSLGSTFLNLLVKELQNQDPTAPMDSTAMVGQMISLNQLDQLISINQKTTTSTPATAKVTGMTAAKAVSAATNKHSDAAVTNALTQPNAAAQIPFLRRSAHGGVSAPIEPGLNTVPGTINDFGNINADPSAFALPGFSDISGGK